MATQGVLHHSFTEAAARYPERTAVLEPEQGSISYRDLDELSDRTCRQLRNLGVTRGDRVLVYLRKSIDAIGAIYGILKAGAAYVPVDPGAPAPRSAYIAHNCAVKAIFAERRFEEKLRAELSAVGAMPAMLVLDDVGGGTALRRALDQESSPVVETAVAYVASAQSDLAYVLYTSGSTGRPKGVMLSHENGVSFVEWCSEVFEPVADDRFSSHAPFHFDLSIFDIHVSLKHGATLVLVSDDIGKDPMRLAELIARERISIWYSAPSILGLLAQFGNLPKFDYSALRLILFAGEVFPVKHLRTLCQLVPKARYFNLYGPTETNVCTYYEVPTPVPPERTAPYPIGGVCSHFSAKVVDDRGQEVRSGEEGELCIAGIGVMRGYWGQADQTARSFLVDSAQTPWYRTGDIVVESQEGNYIYRGRRDRMVKRRGYRVELGEIEAGLYGHPLVKEVAVIALPDEEAGVRITAFLSSKRSPPPSLIEMKQFCSEHLPAYMIPDRFLWQDALPRTSTDKIDYQRLTGSA